MSVDLHQNQQYYPGLTMAHDISESTMMDTINSNKTVVVPIDLKKMDILCSKPYIRMYGKKLTPIPRDERMFPSIMWKYEFCDVINVRASEIQQNAPIFVTVDDPYHREIDIARLELRAGKLNYAIVRPSTVDMKVELWHVNELEVPEEYYYL